MGIGTVANIKVMTEDEMIAALCAAGFEYELSLNKSDLKYPMTLDINQSSIGRFNGLLSGRDGTVYSVDNLDSPQAVMKAVIEAGYSLCYTVKVHA